MDASLRAVVDMVVAAGADSQRASVVCEYVADRCATLTVATAHSSSHASLRNDAYLTGVLGLDQAQIAAWLALVRGTRRVRRADGRVVGGCPGLLEVIATGRLDDRARRRFARLARIAACGSPTVSRHTARPANSSCA